VAFLYGARPGWSKFGQELDLAAKEAIFSVDSVVVNGH
jgi:hypothetical protein